ncbi:MAG: hypothetical protein ACJAU6_003090 [Alphaproteobacteria bacterium]
MAYTALNRVGLSLVIPSLNVAALRAVPADKNFSRRIVLYIFPKYRRWFRDCAVNGVF